jgi:hypothetical protein
VFDLEPRREPPQSGAPLGAIALLLMLTVAGVGYWLWPSVENTPVRPSEPTVTLPVSTVRDLQVRLENAQRLNEDAIGEMGRVQTLIRSIAPYFRANGFETNNRRSVEIDNRALSAMRLNNQSIDELTLVLKQLQEEQ